MNIIFTIFFTGVGGNYLILYLLLFSLYFAFYIFKNKKIIIPKTSSFIYLLIFEISYAFFAIINNVFNINILFIPLIMYYLGIIIFSLFCKNNNTYEDNIKKYILSIGLGLFIHAMLNYFTNINSINRNIIDFWLKSSFSATLQGTFVVMTVSLLFYLLYCEKKKIKKLLGIICIIMSIMFLMLIGTRTPLLILIFVFFFELILYLIINKKITKYSKTIVTLLILCIIFLNAYNKNLYNIKYIVENSNLYVRLGQNDTNNSDSERFENQYLAIKSLIENPFGTKEKIGNLNYAHNMWLDIGKDVGIIPFLFLLLFTINSIILLLKIIKSKLYSQNYKILISSVLLGMLISFCVEPILQGIPYYFGIYTLIIAMLEMNEKKLKDD